MTCVELGYQRNSRLTSSWACVDIVGSYISSLVKNPVLDHNLIEDRDKAIDPSLILRCQQSAQVLCKLVVVLCPI